MGFETTEQGGRYSDLEEQLNLLRACLAERTAKGYPEMAGRLVISPDQLEFDENGRVVLPDGVWNVDEHPDQPYPELAPTLEKQAELLKKGYTLDSKGRPLHPLFLEMVSDPTIGVVLGKGQNWEWAEGFTSDSIVMVEDEAKVEHILMVKRGDTGLWALPGGFRGPGESAFDGAVRETREETGFAIPESAEVIQVYEGVVADIRATAHAWHNTKGIAFRLEGSGPLPKVKGLDDAKKAAWIPLEALLRGEVPLHGAHPFLLRKAAEALENTPRKLDLSAEKWTKLLQKAPIYAKTGLVRVRPAVPGEVVRTILADGTEETTNVALENQSVVTGAGGEEYIIGNDKIVDRYEPTEVEGVFRAKGKIRAIGNPTGEKIRITAPWGEEQVGGPDCKIAVIYDSNDPATLGKDRYIIGGKEFAETYAPLDRRGAIRRWLASLFLRQPKG